MATHRWTPVAPIWGHVGPHTNESVAGTCAPSGEMGCLFIPVIRLEVGQNWRMKYRGGDRGRNARALKYTVRQSQTLAS